MSTKKLTIIWVIIAIAALAGGFFWGKSAGGSSSTAGRAEAGRFAFGSSTTAFAGRGAAGAVGGFTTGQVLSINANSLTLQLANGNSENVFFSSSTQVIVPQPTSIASVQTGTTVMVSGATNSDGSVTASTIQLRNAQ
jgi:hypothetical protein